MRKDVYGIENKGLISRIHIETLQINREKTTQYRKRMWMGTCLLCWNEYK